MRPTKKNSLISSVADLSRKRHLRGGDLVIVALIAVYLAATGLWPMLRLLIEALAPGPQGEAFGLAREVLVSPAFLKAFWNTLTVSAGSVLVSAGLGIALAYASGLMRLPGQVALGFLALSPLLIPSQIMTLAWIQLMGPSSPVLGPLGLAPTAGQPNPLYSGAGIAWLLGIEHMPLVFLAVRASLIAIPGDLIEAARISGASGARITARIILPLTLPAAAAGAILAFASAVGNFGVPALLGIPGRFPMLTTLIYQRLNGFGPGMIGKVAVMALVLVVLAGAALTLRNLFQRLFGVPLPAGKGFEGFAESRLRWPVAVAAWLVVALLAILPMIALTITALSPAIGVRFGLETATLDNLRAALANPAIRRAFANSLTLSVAAAGLSALVAIALAWFAVIGKIRLARGLNLVADAPFVVPGTVLALAMILVYLPPLPLIGSIYGTAAILLIAYLGRFLPLVLRPVEAAMSAMDPSLDEAARIHGAYSLRRILRIAAPIVAPSALAGAMLIVLTAINELTVSALLWSAGHETVGVMIFSLQYEGNSTGAAALSVLSVALVVVLALITDLAGRRLPPGTLPWRAR